VKKLLILFAAFLTLSAAQIVQDGVIKTKNSVLGIHVYQNLLFAATNNGTVEIFDLKNNSLKNEIMLPQFKSGFSDELVSPRVINTDTLDGEKVLILSDDTQGGKALFMYEGGELRQIFSHKDKLNISKAYFVDESKIILGTLGNEIKLYDLKQKTFLYSVQPYWSMLTDFSLSHERNLAFVASEGGMVYMYDTQSGKKLREFALHTDITLGVSFASGVIVGGGADKKCSIAFVNENKTYYINTAFPIYAVGISSSGKRAACVLNEQNDILLFDTASGTERVVLRGNPEHHRVNTIIFLGENDIITASNSRDILRWRLK